MMKWIDIEAFRGLENLRLDGLGRINLLLGPNNSGKTSVLEAISLLLEPERRQSWERAAGFRGAWPFLDGMSGNGRVQAAEWLFPRRKGRPAPILIANSQRVLSASGVRVRTTDEEIPQPLELLLAAAGGPAALAGASLGALLSKRVRNRISQERRGLRITVSDARESLATQESAASAVVEVWERGTFPEDDPSAIPLVMLNGFSHRHGTALQAQVSALIKSGGKSSVVRLLGQLAPGIVDLHILTDDDRGHGIFIEHEAQGFVPLSTFGDGMRRTLHFAAGVLQARGGTLLIDEIEIAIHTSVIGAVFDWLVDACVDNDVQLFVTTHSLEAVDAILEGSRESLDDIVSYRLEGGRLKKRLGGERLHRLRYKMASEVRG